MCILLLECNGKVTPSKKFSLATNAVRLNTEECLIRHNWGHNSAPQSN